VKTHAFRWNVEGPMFNTFYLEKANDHSTADLLTQRLQIHEKTAWTLRSLLK